MNASLRPTLLAITALSIALSTAAWAQNPVVSEYTLKAAYLYHFVQFTEWPESTLRSLDSFTICIAKDNPLRFVVSDLGGQLVHGKPIAVRSQRNNDDQECQVMVLSANDLQGGPPAQEARKASILTIAEGSLAPTRAIITLKMEDRRLIFTIDQTLAEESGLQISSKLLRLAKSVK